MNRIESERLFLQAGRERRLTPEELQKGHRQYIEGHNDPDCTLEHYEEEVMYSYLTAKRSPYGYYNLTVKESGKSAGYCNFFPKLCDAETMALITGNTAAYGALELEIGWSVLEDQRGYGYASEAAVRLAQLAFEELNIRRLVAFTEPDNQASIRVMEKTGMRIQTSADGKRIAGVLQNNR